MIDTLGNKMGKKVRGMLKSNDSKEAAELLEDSQTENGSKDKKASVSNVEIKDHPMMKQISASVKDLEKKLSQMEEERDELDEMNDKIEALEKTMAKKDKEASKDKPLMKELQAKLDSLE